MSLYGTKYTCFNCKCKFYDLNRPEPICPKCKANQMDAPKVEPKIPYTKKSYPKIDDSYYESNVYDEDYEDYDNLKEIDEEPLVEEEEEDKYDDE